MELYLIGIIIPIGYMGYGVYSFLKEYQILKDLLQKNHYERLNYNKFSFIYFIFSLIAGVLLLIISFRKKDIILYYACLIIVSFACMEILKSPITNVLYFNEKECIINNKLIKYKRIRKITISDKKFASCEIITFENETIETPKKIAEFLKDKLKK